MRRRLQRGSKGRGRCNVDALFCSTLVGTMLLVLSDGKGLMLWQAPWLVMELGDERRVRVCLSHRNACRTTGTCTAVVAPLSGGGGSGAQDQGTPMPMPRPCHAHAARGYDQVFLSCPVLQQWLPTVCSCNPYT